MPTAVSSPPPAHRPCHTKPRVRLLSPDPPCKAGRTRPLDTIAQPDQARVDLDQWRTVLQAHKSRVYAGSVRQRPAYHQGRPMGRFTCNFAFAMHRIRSCDARSGTMPAIADRNRLTQPPALPFMPAPDCICGADSGADQVALDDPARDRPCGNWPEVLRKVDNREWVTCQANLAKVGVQTISGGLCQRLHIHPNRCFGTDGDGDHPMGMRQVEIWPTWPGKC